MIRVAIVDDKVNNRKVIADKLVRNNFFTVVFQAVNGVDFLTQMRSVPEDDRPHIVLTAYRLLVPLPLYIPL
jgi:CheY-like chemotaxis protein